MAGSRKDSSNNNLKRRKKEEGERVIIKRKTSSQDYRIVMEENGYGHILRSWTPGLKPIKSNG